MWVFLPIVSLLMRAAVGDPETDNARSDVIKLENERNDMFDDRIGGSTIDESKKWEKEEVSFPTGKNKKQTDNASDGMTGNENLRSAEYNRGADSGVKIVTKRTPSAGYWFDSSLNNKGFDHEKKNPWIYSRGGKRISVYEPAPVIRRPIRVPFYNWAGKRGKLDAQSKRTKLMYTDRDDKGVFADRSGVKREAEAKKVKWTIPFNIWGGKRSRKSSDQESDRQQLMLVMDPNLNDALRQPASIKDEFHEDEDFRNNIQENSAVEAESAIRTMFDEWDGKRNDFPYRIPLPIINETSENDYMTRDEEIANVDGRDNNDDNWLLSMHNEKKDGQFKKILFSPWSGKKNFKTYGFRLGNYHFTVPARARHSYFFWGG